MKEAYIVSAKRTPIGGFLGSLSDLTAAQLGSIAVKEVYTSAQLNTDAVEAVYMGHVLSANTRQAAARQAALFSGLPVQADCTAVNKVCASGLKAVVMASQQIQLNINQMVIAGGMESMSMVPHYLYNRRPQKLGDHVLEDGLLKDGLTDAYSHLHMGHAAELCARTYKISRTEQDEYALLSYERAQRATEAGKFVHEIVPVKLPQQNPLEPYKIDEDIYKIIPEKLPLLKPAFEKNGSVTAANASNLNDGAAAVLLASSDALKKYALRPMAKILSYADAAKHPDEFTTAPAVAMYKALQMANLTLQDIDFFEINEAYASVIIAHQQIMGLKLPQLNVYGGAIAMGHPLGASGARILCTLLHVLQQEGGRYGMAAICNGGGGATAMIIENLLN